MKSREQLERIGRENLEAWRGQTKHDGERTVHAGGGAPAVPRRWARITGKTLAAGQLPTYYACVFVEASITQVGAWSVPDADDTFYATSATGQPQAVDDIVEVVGFKDYDPSVPAPFNATLENYRIVGGLDICES